MKMSGQTYQTIRKIHLYACLTTVVFFLMYLISGFMMMHHDTFHIEETPHTDKVIPIKTTDLEENTWTRFLKMNGIKGRNTADRTQPDGTIIKEYWTPGEEFKLTINPDQSQVRIESVVKNLNGVINDLHRVRSYKGPILWHLYALMIDLTAIAMILFVLTGIILWLKVLKNKRIGWTVLFLGVFYVGLTMYYLMR